MERILFLEDKHFVEDEYLNYCEKEGESPDDNRTKYIEIFPKTIVNKVTSEDIGLAYSMNPYQGCEHGCIYCYARTTHEFWGYSSGLDFETKILFKRNAPQLLEKRLNSKNWKPVNIMFSGNTDCYQPIEKKLEITREMLKVLYKFRHPVSIITKNKLVLRDLDLLKKMARLNLVNVSVSITTLSEETRRIVEPRTASIKNRLDTVKVLSENGIPVNVMMAPIIPAINSHEIFNLVKKVSELGALSAAYTIVRLNGTIGDVFIDWVHKAYPERANKILHQIEDCHGGSLNDSRYKKRMSGEGKIAEQVAIQFGLAKRKFMKGKQFPTLDYSLFRNDFNRQISMF
nr:uncharacterized protein LOC113826432 [Penaeus vannamei]